MRFPDKNSVYLLSKGLFATSLGEPTMRRTFFGELDLGKSPNIGIKRSTKFPGIQISTKKSGA